jgi:Tol biopolymer transport system component
MGNYERVISDAEAYLKLSPDKPASVAGILPAIRGRVALDTKNFSPLQYQIFCALTALGEYDKATALFRQIISPGHEARKQFQEWCMKYVFDTLETGRSWHPQDREPAGASVSRASRPRSEGGTPSAQRGQDGRDTAGRLWHPADAEPAGAAFLPMVEAEETYLELSAKARRLTTDGFSARWSPDGKKLAFSLGVHGYSGVAVFDPATRETDLLIVPGKDPRWSPDGKYIAFVRDCQLLRLEEMASAERNPHQRPVTDEEVWLMKSNGTESRLLARGSWPSWGRDSKHIYYQSRVDNVLFSISIANQNAEPKRIMKCSNSLASVSPDNQHVSFFDAGKLKIKDLASKKSILECPVPSMAWGVTAWSPTGNEVCIGGSNLSREKIGLWIYDLDKSELSSVLNGQIGNSCWSARGTNLAIGLGLPYLEIWTADIDPNVSTIEALGPGQTLDEHVREMLAFYSRRIEADPQDAYAYSGRAHYYDCLNDKAKAKADMRQWSSILSGMSSCDLQVNETQKIKRILSGPFGYQLVFSVEERENDIQVPCIALGQKGRCNMKSFQIPMLSMSLLGLCLLSGLDTPVAHADFAFGEPINLKSVIPVLDANLDVIGCFSSDGLEMYISSWRPYGSDYGDLYVLRRTSKDEEWGPPENLGAVVNGSMDDSYPSISADGLMLYFHSNRPGGSGGWDIWATERATKSDPWSLPVNLGPNVNSSRNDGGPWVSPDSLELYFASVRSGGYGRADIYVARRATTDEPWAEAVNLGPVVNSPYDEDVSLSPDGLLLFFADDFTETVHRPGGYGGGDIWMSRRASLSDPWQEPVNIGSLVNNSIINCTPSISPDGSTLYFYTANSVGTGTWEAWQASIEPVVDFNGDGIVNAADVCIMVEHWYTDEPLCDIGPMPWGDGIVDVQDLIVLSEHLFEEIPPADPNI